MNDLPPLNPLRAFEAAGRLKSIRKAAVELSVTAGAISRQVRSLEKKLGVPLFKRTPGTIHLTPRGERYLVEISASLDGIRRATRKLSGRRTRDVLKICAYTTIAMKWLIPRLSSFHAANQSTDVFITASVEDVNFNREDVDAAIRLGSGQWTGCQYDPLMSNVMVPVCSPQFMRIRRIQTLADLVGQPLLHSIARPEDWAEWVRHAGVKDVDAYAGPKYESSALAYQAAIEGQGIAMATKAFIVDDFLKKRLVQPFGPEVDRENFTYYLVYPANRVRNRAFREFRKWLLREGHQ
jgi:LysR family glycine cleavage system transcriptional activator